MLGNKCSKLPDLVEPYPIVIFGTNVIVLDENGVPSVLDSNVGVPSFLYNDIGAGRIYWLSLADRLLPAFDGSNNGFVFRVSGNITSIENAGIPYQSAANPGVDNVPGIIPLGTNGQFLTIDALGFPVFADLPVPAPATNQSVNNLDELGAQNTSVSAVNATANQVSLYNGTDYVTKTLVNVNANLASPVGVGGLDSGTEASDTWYYMFIVSDGTNVGLMISTNPSQPNFGTTGYSYYARVGAFRNDSSGDIVNFVQRGRKVRTKQIQVSNAEAVTTNWALQTFDVAAIADVVPPIVKSLLGEWTATQTFAVATDATVGGALAGTGVHESMNTSNQILNADIVIKDPTNIQMYIKAAVIGTYDSWINGYYY